MFRIGGLGKSSHTLSLNIKKFSFLKHICFNHPFPYKTISPTPLLSNPPAGAKNIFYLLSNKGLSRAKSQNPLDNPSTLCYASVQPLLYIMPDITDLFNPIPPEASIPKLLSQKTLSRHKRQLLEETLLNEILGPNGEHIHRLTTWLNEQATANPKIYAQILTRLLPPPSDENTTAHSISNTLVIVDQTNKTSDLIGPEKQPKLPQTNQEPISAAFSLPKLKETSLNQSKPKFVIKKCQTTTPT